MYNQLNKLCLLYCFVIWLGFTAVGFSQITISTPSIGFTQACASSTFNTYNFSFSFYPVQNLGASNQFIVELSDSNGSFASPTVVKTLTNTTSPVSSNFVMPTNVYGEGYKIRVRSTNPVKTSPVSNAFAAYYAIHNQPFSINGNNGTVSLCGNESYLLQIDNNGTPASPVYYPDLNYIWYKNFIEISGEDGPTLNVSEAGSYYVIVDYGTCVMNSYSNIVQVQIQSALSPTIEAENNTTAICPNDTKTLTSVLQNSGYTYTWYKDDVALANSNSPTYEASLEGVYHVTITTNGCTFESNALSLEVIDFNLSLNTASQLLLIPGETISVDAVTDATSPQYQWYKNNVAISGATQMNINVTQAGTYKVIVTESTPCNIVKESTVEVIYPLGFDAVIQTSSGYSPCVSTSTTLTISEFDAITTDDEISILGNTYNYSYQWFKNNVAVAGATATSLLLNNASQNGTYTLKITIPDFGVVVSNAVIVNLALENVAITSANVLCESGTSVLSSSVTNSGYSYQWYKDNVALAGATSSTFTANAEGSYHLIISSGTCTKQSNTIVLEIPTFTVSTTTPSFDIILPGEQKVLSVTTTAVSPQFAWYRNNILISDATQNSYTATQNGEYKVVVTQNQGCLVQEEKIFVLEYPTSFNITIATNSGYNDCDNDPTTLTLDSFIANTSIGPIDLTNTSNSAYTYQWYKNNVVVSGATSQSITLNDATQNGNYKLSVTLPDFAPVFSNIIMIKLAPEAVTISNQNILCEGGDVLFSSDVTNPNYTYQWYKNNTAISGATSSTFTATTIGDYHLIVSNSGCTTQSNTITLEIAQINVSSSSPVTDIILPGETKVLTVSTDAVQPQYAWYKNNVLISGQTQSSLSVIQPGTYKVVVTQTQGCNAVAEKTFILEYPTGFQISIISNSDYNPCNSDTITLSLEDFIATTSNGDITVSNTSGYVYQWFKNGTSVSGTTSSSITLNSETQNGIYKLSVTLPDFAPVLSNEITVNLIAGEPLAITANGQLCPANPQILISSNSTDTAYTYTWFKNGTQVASGNNPDYTATEAGTYTLTVTTGICTFNSNALTIQENDFSLTPNVPLTDDIIPGEVKTLSVTTDAVQPTFDWYRNNTLISNANSSSFSVNLDGEYKAVVRQTQGCDITKQIIFVLGYPSEMTISITLNGDFEECGSPTALLNIATFSAQTSEGSVSLLNNSYNYQYQWLKDGQPIAGATSTSLSLEDHEDSGAYALQVVIPDFGTLLSNSITVNLGFIDEVIISTDDIYCSDTTEVTITSSVTNPDYTYNWYRQGSTTLIGTESAITVTEEGDYFLVVSFENCTVTSNSLEVALYNMDLITVDSPSDITLILGTSITITASGAQSYEWYFNDILISDDASIEIEEPGVYTLIATVGECQVTKVFTVTGMENNMMAIPNVVTPNGDGVNDTWNLPTRFVNNNDVEVVIYGPDGAIVFRSSNYLNNWPESGFTYSLKNPVYYYTIMEGYTITERGSITIVKQ